MGKAQTLRFAVGSIDDPASSVWRLVVKKNDVYLGNSKETMGHMKYSFHESGVWVHAFTSQSKMAAAGNRRLSRWDRPQALNLGLTRGPAVWVPTSSLGIRRVRSVDLVKKIVWYPKPKTGFTVHFTSHYLHKGYGVTLRDAGHLIGTLGLANGDKIFLVAAVHPTNKAIEQKMEQLFNDPAYVFTSTDKSFTPDGSLLWNLTSPDEQKTPIIVDMPFPFKHVEAPAKTLTQASLSQPSS